MTTIKAFKALRPIDDYVHLVAAKPYDVLNTQEAKEEVKDNPYSLLNITRPEVHFPDGYNSYAAEVYDEARNQFFKLIENGILKEDKLNCLYVYAQKMGNHLQTGLVALSSVEDYFKDIIKKHEFTRPVKENDRIAHMEAVGAHLGPVFLTYKQQDRVDEIIDSVTAKNPINKFTASDGVEHILWVIEDAQMVNELADIFSKKVPCTYIADGHHRAAASAKVGKKMSENNPNHTGEESYNFFLSVLFPDNQLKIMDYNRLVKDLNGHTAEQILNKLSVNFDISERGTEPIKPETLHQFTMYLDGKWYELTARENTYVESDPIKVLDVTVLSDYVIEPILGIQDQRTDDRIDFVGGIRGVGELQKRVDSGEMKIAFALYPVSIQQLIDIADSGNVMPPKSTWFEPKLRSGLVINAFK